MLGHHHFYNSSRSKKEVLFLLLLFSLNSCENRTSTKIDDMFGKRTKKIDFKPEVALILGSGLGDFADGIKIEQTIEM